MEKEGLVKLKDHKGDITVVSVDSSHGAVAGHRKHNTAGAVEAKERSRVDEEKEEKNGTKAIEVVELWKPNGQSVAFFEELKQG